MHIQRILFLMACLLPALVSPAWADKYEDTIAVFKKAGESGTFFENSYGYALFPTIGKGGIGVGGARGSGRVYAQGVYTGDTTVTQVTVGLQLGGQAYRMVVFFENKDAYDRFTSGKFEFGAQATAVAITAGASAQATTAGTAAGASGTEDEAVTTGSYQNGMAVFTVAKGGLMYEASIGGQKFSFKPKKD